jgi:hypothetical protein
MYRIDQFLVQVVVNFSIVVFTKYTIRKFIFPMQMHRKLPVQGKNGHSVLFGILTKYVYYLCLKCNPFEFL